MQLNKLSEEQQSIHLALLLSVKPLKVNCSQEDDEKITEVKK